MRATAHTVHAHQALGLSPRHSADRIVAALAVQQAAIAFVASSMRSLCRPRIDQRETAPSSAPNGQIARHQKRVTRMLAQQDDEEQQAQHQTLREVRLSKIENCGLQDRVQPFAARSDRGYVAVLHGHKHRARRKVECRQQRQSDGTNQQAEWIERADHHRSEERGHQSRDQHDIFDGLPALVAVRFDALLASLGFRMRCCRRSVAAFPSGKSSRRRNAREKASAAESPGSKGDRDTRRAWQSHS